MATLQYLQLTDTFKVWKEKINNLIDKNNNIIIGTEGSNIPTNDIVDSKIESAINNKIGTEGSNIPTNDIVDSKIESAIDVITQDNIALILTLS